MYIPVFCAKTGKCLPALRVIYGYSFSHEVSVDRLFHTVIPFSLLARCSLTEEQVIIQEIKVPVIIQL